MGSFGWLGVWGWVILDETGFREGCVGTVLRNGLQGAGRHFDGHELLEFGNPYALGLQVRIEVSGSHGSNVHTDTPLLLGETATMDFRTANWAGTCDGALSGHNEIVESLIWSVVSLWVKDF